MAQLAAFIPMIVQGIATIAGGASQKSAAANDAAQLEAGAGSTRATSQRAAINELREARYVISAAKARAAKSGAGATDPTIVNILAEIEAEGEYNALSQLYSGEESARGDELQAHARRQEGDALFGNSIMQGASSFGQKYSAQKYGT